MIRFILLFFIWGCGHLKDNHDPKLYQYALDFQADAYRYHKPITLLRMNSIKYGDLGGEQIGECEVFSWSRLRRYSYNITIDREWAKTAPDWKQKIVVYHEMGHCELHRGHTHNESFMLEMYTAESWIYMQNHWDYMVYELFNER